MPKLRQVDLSSLTNSEVEMGLSVVANSLALNLSPESLSPPLLKHLSPNQWEELFWAHLNLAWQKEHSPLH